MHKCEKVARKRLEILWKHHNENGQLLLRDIPELIGISFENAWITFKTHNLKPPRVWDSRKEKTRRKAQVLNKEAARLKQNYLTLKQAAKVLGTKTSYILGIEDRMLACGFQIPELRNESNMQFSYYNSNPNSDDNFPEIAHKLHGTINPLYHPTGLQVLSYWTDWPAMGQTTYLLR